MQREKVYLDYNASSPLKTEVKKAINDAMEAVGNASSIHSFGRDVYHYIQKARENLSLALKCDNEQIIFTSGGTEANNLALTGLDINTVITTEAEHDSIYKTALKQSDIKPLFVNIDKNGVIETDHLKELLQNSTEKTLISIMYAHNETGVIQPIKDITAIAREYNAYIHCDAVQAFGKIAVDFCDMDVDLLSVSAHKIGGPAGVGALVKKSNIHLKSLIMGGGQEKGYRAGTGNVIGIVGFGEAARTIGLDKYNYQTVGILRDLMESRLNEIVPNFIILGKGVKRLSNTSYVVMPGVTSEKQVIALDLKGFATSSGAACSSGKVTSSRTARAMNLEMIGDNALRVSLGWNTTQKNIEDFVDAWLSIYWKYNQKEVA